jgi:hypothetical protein
MVSPLSCSEANYFLHCSVQVMMGQLKLGFVPTKLLKIQARKQQSLPAVGRKKTRIAAGTDFL